MAFIVYPEGLSKIHVVPQLWSILFFFMLFILGIGSSVAMIETILTSIKDEFESLHKNKAKLAAVFCFIFMILGLPLTTDVREDCLAFNHELRTYLDCIILNRLDRTF